MHCTELSMLVVTRINRYELVLSHEINAIYIYDTGHESHNSRPTNQSPVQVTLTGSEHLSIVFNL